MALLRYNFVRGIHFHVYLVGVGCSLSGDLGRYCGLFAVGDFLHFVEEMHFVWKPPIMVLLDHPGFEKGSHVLVNILEGVVD